MNERKLYMPDLAEKLKARCGQKWQPSNGTEGDIFEEMWCSECKQYADCEIAMNSFVYEITHEKYPSEWQYGPDGQPICTAFDEVDNDAAKSSLPNNG